MDVMEWGISELERIATNFGGGRMSMTKRDKLRRPISTHTNCSDSEPNRYRRAKKLMIECRTDFRYAQFDPRTKGKQDNV